MSGLDKHFPFRKPQLLGEMADSRCGKEVYNNSLEHLVVTDSKKPSKTITTESKGIMSQFELAFLFAKDRTILTPIRIITAKY